MDARLVTWLHALTAYACALCMPCGPYVEKELAGAYGLQIANPFPVGLALPSLSIYPPIHQSPTARLGEFTLPGEANRAEAETTFV